MVKFASACVERDKKILKKWIFALTPLRILLRSSVPKAQGISPNESGLFLV